MKEYFSLHESSSTTTTATSFLPKQSNRFTRYIIEQNVTQENDSRKYVMIIQLKRNLVDFSCMDKFFQIQRKPMCVLNKVRDQGTLSDRELHNTTEFPLI
jgi:hypothetical protein